MIWHTAGGDNSRRGLFGGATKIRKRPNMRLQARGAIQASVVFDHQGTAFVADMAGWVQAFSGAGKLRWRTQLLGAVSATPAVHATDLTLFVGTHAGSVYALDTATGATRWRKEVPTRSDPRILSDLLFHSQAGFVVLSSWGGRFIALSAASGAERFSWDAGISPGAAVAEDRAGVLYSLRAVNEKGVQLVRVTATGEETVLHAEAESSRGARRALVMAAPVVDDASDTVYCVFNGDKEGALCALSLKSESMLWRTPLPAAVQATPGLRSDGSVVVADLAGSLLTVSPDGGVRSRYVSGCEYLVAGAVSDARGACYVGDPVGNLHAVASEGTGRTVFEAKRAIQARPSFDASGRLYLPSTDRTVYVFPS